MDFWIAWHSPRLDVRWCAAWFPCAAQTLFSVWWNMLNMLQLLLFSNKVHNNHPMWSIASANSRLLDFRYTHVQRDSNFANACIGTTSRIVNVIHFWYVYVYLYINTAETWGNICKSNWNATFENYLTMLQIRPDSSESQWWAPSAILCLGSIWLNAANKKNTMFSAGKQWLWEAPKKGRWCRMLVIMSRPPPKVTSFTLLFQSRRLL